MQIGLTTLCQERLRELVQKWQAGPQQAPDDLLEWYDNLLDSYVSWDDSSCDALQVPADAPANRTLGQSCSCWEGVHGSTITFRHDSLKTVFILHSESF